MASAEDIFSRFWMWKKSHTVLRLTVLTKGGTPEKLIGEIAAIDEDAFLVSFVTRKKGDFRTIWLGDASFGLEDRVLSAERLTGDILRFEEL
jgi:hypothetical protein